MEDKQTHHQTKISIFEVCDISSVYLAGFAPRTHLLYIVKRPTMHIISRNNLSNIIRPLIVALWYIHISII